MGDNGDCQPEHQRRKLARRRVVYLLILKSRKIIEKDR